VGFFGLFFFFVCFFFVFFLVGWFCFFERKEYIVQGSLCWGVAITLQSEERNKVRRRRDYLPSLLPKGLEP